MQCQMFIALNSTQINFTKIACHKFGRWHISEVESRTQDSRPWTQKKSEAKDRPSRDQQGTGASVLQTKGLQNFFSGDLQFNRHTQNF